MCFFNIGYLIFYVKLIFVATLVEYFEVLSNILGPLSNIQGLSMVFRGLCIVCRGFV